MADNKHHNKYIFSHQLLKKAYRQPLQVELPQLDSEPQLMGAHHGRAVLLDVFCVVEHAGLLVDERSKVFPIAAARMIQSASQAAN